MINIGQIGVGAWGRNLLRNLTGLSDCRVVCCADISQAALERVKQIYPHIRVSQDPEGIIADPELDAVVIATPPAGHFQMASRALKSGKDVFVEKPLALSLQDAQELVRLSEGNGRILMVGHLMEYHPALVQLKGYIEEGELGDIYYIYSTRVNLGKIRRDENALWSFAPHDISMILYLLPDPPVRVTAVGQYYIQNGIEDVVFMTLHFRNGAMAHIHVSWLDPHKIRKLTVVGSRKMAVFDDTQSAEPIRIYDKGVEQGLDYQSYGEALALRMGDILIPRVKMSEPLRLECEHFIDCVIHRRRPRSDGVDGLRVVRILDAAQRSMEAGGTPVEIAG